MISGEYYPSAPKEISSALDRLFSSIEGELEHHRSASRNFIILVSALRELEHVEEVIDAISFVHPGRFFAVSFLDEPFEIQVDVAVRSNIFSRTERVCSEIVRIRGGRDKAPAVHSLVLTNLLSGRGTDLFMSGSGAPIKFITHFDSLLDSVIFDSAAFAGDFEQLELLASLRPALADLQWIRAGIWREEVRKAFDKPVWAALLPELRCIKLTAVGEDYRPGCIPDLLLGWLVDRLELEVHAYSRMGFECRDNRGKSLAVQLTHLREKSPTRLRELEFNFAEAGNEERSLCFSASAPDTLEIHANAASGYRSSAPLPDESSLEVIKRFYAVGESTSNYRQALRHALELARLRKGFGGS